MEERTASPATVGQIKDLVITVGQGVPADLPAKIARGHLANKSDVHKWVRLGLARDLSQMDFSLVGAVLEGRLALRFSATTRQSLKSDGWFIIEVPGGVTLKTLLGDEWKHSHLYGGELEMKPTRYQEIAVCPTGWTWPTTMGMTFSEVLDAREELEKETQEKYGEGVRVVLPTLELVSYFFSGHTSWPVKFHNLWTANDFGRSGKANILIECGHYLSSGKQSIRRRFLSSSHEREGLMRMLEPSF